MWQFIKKRDCSKTIKDFKDRATIIQVNDIPQILVYLFN